MLRYLFNGCSRRPRVMGMRITGVFGGCTNGVEKFSNVELTSDGNVILDDIRGNSVLDISDPIRKIRVYGRDNTVVGIEVTYKLTDGTVVPLARGETTAGLGLQEVNLGRYERLIYVHGRAGKERNTNTESVTALGFAVRDIDTGYIRNLGLFPNGTNRRDGDPFQVNNVFAFGGFERATERTLRGLYFYSDPDVI